MSFDINTKKRKRMPGELQKNEESGHPESVCQADI